MQYSEIIIDQSYVGLNPVQFGTEDCDPSHSFGPAVRTHWLLHYVKSGSGIFEKDGKKWLVEKGDIFVIAPYEMTYYEASAHNPWHYTWIGFTSGELFLKKLPPVLHVEGAGAIFESMASCCNLSSGKSAFLSGKLWELMSLILEETNQKTPSYIELAINRMQAEYMNGIQIEQIAQELHIDRSYLCDIFRKETGLSPKEYLTDLRLKKAIDLMIHYGQTPSTAAISTGYPDIYSFSKMFKRKYGISPRAYLAQNNTDLDDNHS